MVETAKNHFFPCQHQWGGSGKRNVVKDLLGHHANIGN